MSRPRGRPRDADVDGRILAATYDAVSSLGYENLTVDEIVARAGVSKATLYRRWATKEELVIRCLQDRAVQDNPPSTGDWRADVEQAVEAVITLVNTDAGRAMLAVTAASYNNIDLSRLFTRDETSGPIASIRDALVRGMHAGELRADLDLDLAMDLVISAIPFRMLVLNEQVPAGLSKFIVEMVIDGAGVRD